MQPCDTGSDGSRLGVPGGWPERVEIVEESVTDVGGVAAGVVPDIFLSWDVRRHGANREGLRKPSLSEDACGPGHDLKVTAYLSRTGKERLTGRNEQRLWKGKLDRGDGCARHELQSHSRLSQTSGLERHPFCWSARKW